MPFVNRTHRLGRGLVGLWLLNERSGNKVFDLSGNNSMGVITNAIWVPGKYGPAIYFDGNDYIDTGVTSLPGTSLFCDSSQKFSIVISFNAAAAATGSFIAKAGAVTEARTFQMFISGASNIFFLLRGAQTEGIAVADSENHILVMTWDGTTARYYLDGIYKGTLNVGAAAEETTQRIIFGARTNGTGFFLTGKENYVYIYNRALSPSEVAEIYADFTVMMQKDNIALMAVEAPAPTGGQVIMITTLPWILSIPLLYGIVYLRTKYKEAA